MNAFDLLDYLGSSNIQKYVQDLLILLPPFHMNGVEFSALKRRTYKKLKCHKIDFNRRVNHRSSYPLICTQKFNNQSYLFWAITYVNLYNLFYFNKADSALMDNFAENIWDSIKIPR